MSGAIRTSLFFYKTAAREPKEVVVAGYVEEVKYDDLGRLNRIIIHGSTGQIISEMRMEYESKEGKTSGRPSQIEYYERAGSGNLSSSPEKTLRYMYDGMGNILEVRDGTDKTLYSYGYSKANQLVREDNMVFGKSYVTVYDRYGNITAQKAEPYKLNHSPETVVGSYAYDTDGRLSGYNGQAMAYDALGNPTTYRNKAVVWEKGRQMKSFNGIAFGYDGSGRRIRKGNVTYTYDASGNLISSSDGLEYLYGMNGLLAVNDNGTIYFCRKDVQGNIIALLDANGKVVVQYVYDAWGNHAVLDSNGNDLTSSSHIGNRNPFRYRGYFYDVETGLYYLQTRYYDPEVGRFLNMDDVSYADPEQFHGLNLYAYCANDPVNNVDPTGHKWWEFWKWDWAKIGMIATSAIEIISGIGLIIFSHGTLIDKGIGLIATGAGSIISGVLSEANNGSFLAGWTGGQVSGLVSTFIPVIGGVVGSFSGSLITDVINGNKPNFISASLSAGISLLFSVPSALFAKIATEAAGDIFLQVANGRNIFLNSFVGSLIDYFMGSDFVNE